MWNLGVIICILAIITIAGIINVRSLVRKMKANPGKWIDLGIGILVWGAAIIMLTLELLKHLDVIVR